MPATYDDVRRLALAFPGVTEGTAYGTPSLHFGRKLLGRLREDGETLVLKTEATARDRLFAAEPDTFYLTDHYRNSGMMLVNLLAVRAAALPALVEAAWRQVATRRVVTVYEQASASAREKAPRPPSAGRTSASRARRSATTPS